MLKQKLLASLAGLVGLATIAMAQTTELLVYTALETDQMKPYKEAFEKANPGIVIKWVRDSTGVVTAKLLAEKANPQADFVWGLAATSLAVLEDEKMLLAYEPKGYKDLNPAFNDDNKVPYWVGMDVWGATICFNTVEAAKLNIPKPTSWKDLTKPIYKGQISMPNAASSGTGLLDVTSWLQMFGEKEGWAFMDALHENIGQYTHSGSKPCRQAGAGEFVVGISFEYRAAQVKSTGAPIDMVFPKEGLGWDIETFGIMANTKKLDAAKKLSDFAASKEANELYQKSWAIVSHKDVHKPNPIFPANYEQLLVKNDFRWIAKNRDKIINEWVKRYSSKSEK